MTEHAGPESLFDPMARQMTEAFVAMQQESLPGLVERVYVTGSALTSDFVVPESDLDLVFECSRQLSADDIAVLNDLHARTSSKPYVDGVYLTSAQVKAGPDSIESAPQATNAVLAPAQAQGQLNWVTWLWMLASPVGIVKGDGTLSWRGHAGFDRAEITRRAGEYSRANLHGYWGPSADQMQTWVDAQQPGTTVPAESVVWMVLGATRLLVTINEGRVVSKAESGRYVTMLWPEYTDLVDRCLRSRAGEDVAFDLDDARASAEVVRRSVALAGDVYAA